LGEAVPRPVPTCGAEDLLELQDGPVRAVLARVQRVTALGVPGERGGVGQQPLRLLVRGG
jgi:hypothetical protein